MEYLETFFAPFSFLLDPEKRIYWFYLLTSLIAASLVTSFHQKGFNAAQQIKALLNANYWLNRSTALDVVLLFTNSVIRLTLLIPFFGSRLVTTILVGSFLQTNVADSPSFDVPWYLIAILFSVTFFVTEDLSRFGLHLLMHRVNFLWVLHKVHHSATNLTPLTLFRVHPLESIFYFIRGLIVFGLVSGVFVWLFGSKVNALHILGVDLFGFIFAAVASNLRHSPLWLSFGKLEAVFISPAQHQLHHSKHHDHPNYGTCLSLWDNFFNSLEKTTLRKPEKELVFGLADHPARQPLTYLKAHQENGQHLNPVIRTGSSF